MAATSRLRIETNDTTFKRPHIKSPRERTLELGPRRLEEAKKAIRALRQLANPQNHELRGREPDKLVASLREEVDALEYELANPGKIAPALGIFERD